MTNPSSVSGPVGNCSSHSRFSGRSWSGVQSGEVGVYVTENQIAHAAAPRRQDANYRRRANGLHEIARAKRAGPENEGTGWNSAYQHAIAVAVEAVFGCDGVAIGAQDIFFSGERGYKRQ